MSHGHYRRLLLMTVLSFAAMYALMYAMVNSFANVHANLNQSYMAGLMTAPMVSIEVALMSAMYPSKKLNALIVAGGAVVTILCWVLIRRQVGIDDRQFLESMIPHHAGAILMCDEASIEDPTIEGLCRTIRSSQQAEIDWMKAKLTELGR